MNISDIGETGLIDLISTNLNTDNDLIMGIGDDTAVIRQHNSKYLLATCDMLIENIHFTLDSSEPEQIGHKCMAVNLSDIAAMGGIPRHALISIALPENISSKFVNMLYNGIKNLADNYSVNLAGGDTVSSNQDIVINITLLGEVEPEHLTLRSGAEPEDLILTTGQLGISRAGLELILNPKIKETKFCRENQKLISRWITRHLEPQPRIKESRRLIKEYTVSSMNDISDGLAKEIHEICSASQCGAEIWENKLPQDRRIQNLLQSSSEKKYLDWLLFGGEDFELLFTMPEKEGNKMLKNWTGYPVCVIGRIKEKQDGIKLISSDSKKIDLENKGYDHFALTKKGKKNSCCNG